MARISAAATTTPPPKVARARARRLTFPPGKIIFRANASFAGV
jgi:hypothetical protein